MKRIFPLALAAVIALAVYLYFNRDTDPGPGSDRIEYTLVSDMVLEALLADSAAPQDTGKIAMLARLALAAPPPGGTDAGIANDNRRNETNELASAGIIGTCCCPCDDYEMTQPSLRGGGLCPCPTFDQLQFLAPVETETEISLDDERYTEQPLPSGPKGWEVFRLPTDSKVLDGEHTLRFKGKFFGSDTAEEIRLNITIRDGKAYLH